MKLKVKNIARRPIALHCNSGETLHLPPAYTLEIEEAEIQGSPLVKKLAKQKLLLVNSAKEAKKTVSSRTRSKKT